MEEHWGLNQIPLIKPDFVHLTLDSILFAAITCVAFHMVQDMCPYGCEESDSEDLSTLERRTGYEIVLACFLERHRDSRTARPTSTGKCRGVFPREIRKLCGLSI